MTLTKNCPVSGVHSNPDAPPVKSVFPGDSGSVQEPYGGFYLEAMDSHGGWIASSIDLVRFLSVLDSGKPNTVLKPETVRLMVSRPYSPLWAGADYYYGMGLNVRPQKDDANWWHTGSLSGTSTILVRTADRYVWGLMFNSRPKDQDTFLLEVDRALWQARQEATEWPIHDLFKQYGYK